MDRKAELDTKKKVIAEKIARLEAKAKVVAAAKKPGCEEKLAKIAGKVASAKATVALCDAKMAKLPSEKETVAIPAEDVGDLKP